MPGRESVYKIDLDTEPRSKKTDTRRDRHIQNSKSRSAVADRLKSLSLDFPGKHAIIKVWKPKTVATSRHT